MSYKDNLEGLTKRENVHHLDTEYDHRKKWIESKWDFSAKYRYQKYI